MHKEYLGAIRHWSNLKIGFEGGEVWIKNLDAFQVDSVEVKSIPYKHVYYEAEGHLFLKGSLLPARNMPGVLWSPIERGLEIELPSFNHNYFGIDQSINTRLIPSEKEEDCTGLYMPMKELEVFIQTAPSVRLKDLSWCLLGDNAFILGKPLLPVKGEVLWQREMFFIPAGWDLEYPVLSNVINEMINAGNQCWIIWNKEGQYLKINKETLRPLTISSFRLSRTG